MGTDWLPKTSQVFLRASCWSRHFLVLGQEAQSLGKNPESSLGAEEGKTRLCFPLLQFSLRKYPRHPPSFLSSFCIFFPLPRAAVFHTSESDRPQFKFRLPPLLAGWYYTCFLTLFVFYEMKITEPHRRPLVGFHRVRAFKLRAPFSHSNKNSFFFTVRLCQFPRKQAHWINLQ